MADNQGLLLVTPEQRDELESWAKSRALPAGDVFRARLILALADVSMANSKVDSKSESWQALLRFPGCATSWSFWCI